MLSRVVDSLYWMSRYLERAEHTARLIDVDLHGMIDQDPAVSLRRHKRLMHTVECPWPKVPEQEFAAEMTRLLTYDETNPNSIFAYIAHTRENARQVREQISTEMWEQLNRLYLYVQDSKGKLGHQIEPHDFFMHVKEGSLLFQGIADSTMTHGEGWHFIHVGRYIERAWSVARLLEVHLQEFRIDDSPEVSLEAYQDWTGLLKSCTAFEAYLRRYRSNLTSSRIVEFLILDQDFPHSIRFSIDILHRALDIISEMTQTKKIGLVNRLSGKLSATLDYASIEDIARDPKAFLTDIQQQCVRLHDAIYGTYISYPVETGL
jgi:uncharacterized alpha-E superfamily protein